MKKLNFYIKKDPRIRKVYNYSKDKYLQAAKLQHNFEHVLRDLYRVLVIAQTCKGANNSILLPATIMHDIGVTETDDYSKHVKVGAKIVKRDLPKMGFSKNEIQKIAHAVFCHKDTPKPKTLEGKILYDADKLEKCHIAGVFSFYRTQQEKQEPILEWVKRGVKRAAEFDKEGFFTNKAKLLCGEKGFKERVKHFQEVRDSLQKNRDWTVTEGDLWE